MLYPIVSHAIQGPPLNRELVSRSHLLIVQILLSTKPLLSKLPLVSHSDPPHNRSIFQGAGQLLQHREALHQRVHVSQITNGKD